MKKNISRIITVNFLPPLFSFALLCIYILLLFFPALKHVSSSGGSVDLMLGKFMPYTIGLLFITGVAFIYSSIHNLRTEMSRERLKKSYDIVDEQYQAYIETIADGFIYIPNNGMISADNIVLAMLGYSKDELAFLELPALINNDVDGNELLEYIRSNDDEVTGHYETRLIKKDKTMIEVLLSASKIDTAAMNGFVLIVKDMSDKARTDAARIDIQREESLIELQSALQYIYQNAGSMMVEALSCRENTEIFKAVEQMNALHKNSFIVIDDEGFASGIITDQDLRERLILKNIDIRKPVSCIMSSPVITAEPDIMFFEAFKMMRDNSIRQLVIVNKENYPVGLLSEKKLVEIQSTNAAVLFEELKRAETVDQLRDGYKRLTFSVRTLVLSGAKAINITGVVSKTAEMITLRLIEIMLSKFGPAPCEFAFIAMGSEGRGEQTLLTDQDNGIIFSDVLPDRLESCRQYFLDFGKRVSEALDYIGYSYCKGGVMASNPEWVRSESEWKEQLDLWITSTEGKKMLDINIIFDFKCIYGNKKLSRDLRHELWNTIDKHPSFLREMAATVSEFKPPLTPMGHIKVDHTEHDDEVFNIKKALSPLIIYARTMALQNKISETGTGARLRALSEKEVITNLQFRNFEHAFEYLTLLRFRDQIQTIEDGEPLDNLIYVDELMEVEIITLRKIFKQIASAQDNLRLRFTGMIR